MFIVHISWIDIERTELWKNFHKSGNVGQYRSISNNNFTRIFEVRKNKKLSLGSSSAALVVLVLRTVHGLKIMNQFQSDGEHYLSCLILMDQIIFYIKQIFIFVHH